MVYILKQNMGNVYEAVASICNDVETHHSIKNSNGGG